MSTSFLRGENGTLQHSWELGSDWSQTLTQLSFQLVRNGMKKNNDLLILFRRLLEQSKQIEFGRLYEYLLRLVLYTRDIKQGKGERDLYYSLLKCLADHDHLDDAIALFRYTCSNDLGSWKDVKYLVDFVLKADGETDTNIVSEIHPLAQGALQALAAQIETDYRAYQDNRAHEMSLAARWAPRREKGRFARVTRFFVQTIHASKSYNGTSMRDVRHMLSALNRDLKTPQIDMCRGTWSRLHFNTMTSYTLLKHQKAFLNQTKDGSQRSALEDRVECASHYQSWLGSKEKKMNVSTVFPFEFVRDVIETSRSGDEIVYYNEAWKTQTNEQLARMGDCESPSGSMIPMIDVSGSMTLDKCLPLYNAIALGIRLTELNIGPFRNKALTFESNPKWANYSEQQTFVEKVSMTRNLDQGGNTNFESALDSILTRVVQTRMSPLAVQNMSLVVFSDMQMDVSSGTPYSTVYERFVRKFRKAGLESVYEIPYAVPHIVFWNLRKTSGFPTVMNQPGVTAISGYNANMINVLLTKGVSALRQMTPWSLLREILDDSRFDHLL